MCTHAKPDVLTIAGISPPTSLHNFNQWKSLNIKIPGSDWLSTFLSPGTFVSLAELVGPWPVLELVVVCLFARDWAHTRSYFFDFYCINIFSRSWVFFVCFLLCFLLSYFKISFVAFCCLFLCCLFCRAVFAVASFLLLPMLVVVCFELKIDYFLVLMLLVVLFVRSLIFFTHFIHCNNIALFVVAGFGGTTHPRFTQFFVLSVCFSPLWLLCCHASVLWGFLCLLFLFFTFFWDVLCCFPSFFVLTTFAVQ